jgi:hypothetical protein
MSHVRLLLYVASQCQLVHDEDRGHLPHRGLRARGESSAQPRRAVHAEVNEKRSGEKRNPGKRHHHCDCSDVDASCHTCRVRRSRRVSHRRPRRLIRAR